MNAVQENQQRCSDLRPGLARLRCLRCRSEVACRDEGGRGEEGEAIKRRMRKALMLTGGEEEQEEEEEEAEGEDGGGGET